MAIIQLLGNIQLNERLNFWLHSSQDGASGIRAAFFNGADDIMPAVSIQQAGTNSVLAVAASALTTPDTSCFKGSCPPPHQRISRPACRVTFCTSIASSSQRLQKTATCREIADPNCRTKVEGETARTLYSQAWVQLIAVWWRIRCHK